MSQNVTDQSVLSIQSQTFPSSDGIHSISYTQYLPPERVDSLLIIVHSLCEHMERYDPLCRFLANNHIACFVYDQLGHGKSVHSSDELGFWGESSGINHLMNDLDTMRQKVRETFADQPLFMLGHSMGSALVREYAALYPDYVKGILLSSAATLSPMKGLLRSMSIKAALKKEGPKSRSSKLERAFFGRFNKAIAGAKTERDWMTRNAEALAAIRSDPLCMFVPTISCLADYQKLFAGVSGGKWIGRIRKGLSMYFFAGSADPACNYGKDIEKLCMKLRAKQVSDITIKIYDNARHQVFAETNATDVFDGVQRWIMRHSQTGKKAKL